MLELGLGVCLEYKYNFAGSLPTVLDLVYMGNFQSCDPYIPHVTASTDMVPYLAVFSDLSENDLFETVGVHHRIPLTGIDF